MTEVAAAMIHFDRMTREWCCRFDRAAMLQFDLDQGTVRRQEKSADQAQQSQWAFPHGYHLQSLWLGNQKAADGVVSVPVSRNGRSPSYALLIQAPHSASANDDSRDQRYLLWSGLTGQCVEMTDENQIAQTLRLVENQDAGGNDAR